MVVGFNHNFRYDGETYHIQTEDSGLKSPNIVTLLYQGGTILASKKTSYADIAKVDNLEQVVEELMKEQHKNMLRSLKSGEFDEVIARFKAGRLSRPMELKPAVAEQPDPRDSSEQVAPGAESPAPIETGTPPAADVDPGPKPEPPPAAAPPKKTPPASAVEIGLDEVILSYLLGNDK